MVIWIQSKFKHIIVCRHLVMETNSSWALRKKYKYLHHSTTHLMITWMSAFHLLSRNNQVCKTKLTQMLLQTKRQMLSNFGSHIILAQLFYYCIVLSHWCCPFVCITWTCLIDRSRNEFKFGISVFIVAYLDETNVQNVLTTNKKHYV